MLNNKTVLLIGAEGFLGKVLGDNLVKEGYSLIGIDIQASSSMIKYKHFIQKNIFEISQKEISFLGRIGGYGLINVGGVSRNGNAALSPAESTQNTLSAYFKLLTLLEVNPPQWMMISSTREVDILLQNKELLNGKQKIYSMLKYSTELASESYAEHWNIPLRIVRLSDLFGMGDHPSKAMSIFIQRAIGNEDINVTSPDAMLYLTEVTDVAETMQKHIRSLSKREDAISNELISLWDDDYVISLLELAYLALELNPSSRSKIISEGKAIDYRVKEKISLTHRKVLEDINGSYEKNYICELSRLDQ